MSKGSGTRSGLLWEVERLLIECGDELPQVLLMENVPQVIGKKNIDDFKDWKLFLESKGYSNYYKLLNAKDYGIPQNRNRCFMISILGDSYYEFPEPITLKLKLKDMLEKEVDEKYYLSDKMMDYVLASGTKNYQKAIEIDNEIARTINTTPTSHRSGVDNYFTEKYRKTGEPTPIQEVLKIKNATKKGYLEAQEGDGVDISSRMETHRGTVQKGMSLTIKTQIDVGVVRKGLRISKQTPKECWRLMGFSDEDFDKASKVNSNAQLYKQAGNSIVVNVLMAIFRQLL